MKKGFKYVLFISFTLVISIFINILFFSTTIKEDNYIEQIIDDKDEDDTQIEEEKEQNEKVVYLTFDDGPSINTLKIMDILRNYDIKGTFFVVGYNINKYTENIIKKLYKENHYIGLHTMSHNYYYLYEHAEAHKNFVNEIVEEQKLIYNITGFTSELIRVPYSDGKIFSNKHIEEITNLNLEYMDWNVDTEDWKAQTIDDVLNSIKYSVFLLDNIDTLVV